MPAPALPQRPLAAQAASQTGLGRDSTCWSQVVLVLQEGPGAQRSRRGPLGTRVCSVGREEGTCPSPVTRPVCLGLTLDHSAEPGRDRTHFLDVQTKPRTGQRLLMPEELGGGAHPRPCGQGHCTGDCHGPLLPCLPVWKPCFPAGHSWSHLLRKLAWLV